MRSLNLIKVQKTGCTQSDVSFLLAANATYTWEVYEQLYTIHNRYINRMLDDVSNARHNLCACEHCVVLCTAQAITASLPIVLTPPWHTARPRPLQQPKLGVLDQSKGSHAGKKDTLCHQVRCHAALSGQMTCHTAALPPGSHCIGEDDMARRQQL